MSNRDTPARMVNIPSPDHPLIGTEHVYRPDRPAFDPNAMPGGGTLIVANGMRVQVRLVFENWNGIPGLDMLYVFCPATGMHTHQSPKELTGWDHETTASLLSKTCVCQAAKGGYSTHLNTCPKWECDGLPLSETKCLDKGAHM